MHRPDPRSLSFGSVAEQYERYRPGYPAEVVDTVLAYAGRPLRAAVEVGAGTGKATRLFASAGIRVTALEPDPEMARVLARTTAGLPVQPVVTTFEQYAADGPVDLLFAAAAWHWTDPATRWSRAVGLLVPGGVLALFGAPGDLTDPDLHAALQEVEREVLQEDHRGSRYAWSIDEAADVEGLTDRTQRDLPGTVTLPTQEFLGRLGTLSAYLALEPEARTAALERVRDVLPDRVELTSAVQLSLARRV